MSTKAVLFNKRKGWELYLVFFLFGGSAEVFDLVVDIHPFGSQILKK